MDCGLVETNFKHTKLFQILQRSGGGHNRSKGHNAQEYSNFHFGRNKLENEWTVWSFRVVLELSIIRVKISPNLGRKNKKHRLPTPALSQQRFCRSVCVVDHLLFFGSFAKQHTFTWNISSRSSLFPVQVTPHSYNFFEMAGNPFGDMMVMLPLLYLMNNVNLTDENNIFILRVLYGKLGFVTWLCAWVLICILWLSHFLEFIWTSGEKFVHIGQN